jgi:hypothetical protein
MATMPADASPPAFALLIAYHVEREGAYATITALIGPPTSGDGYAMAGAGRSDTKTAAWLAPMLTAGDIEPWPLPPSIELACSQPTPPVRASALAAARVAASVDKLADLAALSGLAGRIAQALRSGDVVQAAHVNDLQCAFLRLHAHACLIELALQLRRCGSGVHERLGQALQRQLTDDRAAMTLR